MVSLQSPLALENLEEQLENVADFLSRFWNLQQSLKWRFPIRGLVVAWKLSWKLMSSPGYSRSMYRRDPLSGRSEELKCALYAAVATREEQESDVYKALVGDFSYHLISESLLTNYPRYNYAKLKALHEQKQQDRRLQFSASQVLGLLLAAAAVLLKDVPEAIVTRDFGIPYLQFEQGIFWGGIAVFVYLSLILLPAWRQISRSQRKHDFIAYILNYAALTLERPPETTVERSHLEHLNGPTTKKR